jgi:hypothetical protein
MGISGNGVMNFQWFFESIAVGLDGLDLGKVVLDVHEVFVADDRNQEFFVVFEERVAEKGS